MNFKLHICLTLRYDKSENCLRVVFLYQFPPIEEWKLSFPTDVYFNFKKMSKSLVFAVIILRVHIKGRERGGRLCSTFSKMPYGALLLRVSHLFS